MPVEISDGINGDGLFDIQGKAFQAMAIIDSSVNTSITGEVTDALAQFAKRTSTLELQKTIEGLSAANDSLKSAGMSMKTILSRYVERLIIEMVDADNSLTSKTTQVALEELIDQLETASQSVDASTSSGTVTADADNTGNGSVILSVKNGEGRNTENALAEDLVMTCVSNGRTSGFSTQGEAAVPALAVDWPKGSGASTVITSVDASANLLTNSDFEVETSIDKVPDNWIISVGLGATAGGLFAMTDVEEQTITISGTPTDGQYYLHWVNQDGKSETSGKLSYAASQGQVEAELRNFVGLSEVVVTTTGTSPNYTHTVSFQGLGGNMNQISSTDHTTGGSHAIAHATTVAGDSQVYFGGKSLMMLPDAGSTLTTFQQAVTLSPKTCYAVNAHFLRGSGTISAGVITFDLVDGIGGSVIQDDAGGNNSFSFNASDLTTSWKNLDTLVTAETVFHTPTILPNRMYFRWRISTAITSGTYVWVDHMAMSEMSEVYAGGPYLSVFTGSTEWKADDKFTVAIANDRAGAIQEWYNRSLGMSSRGLMLPSNSGGSETIADSLIS